MAIGAWDLLWLAIFCHWFFWDDTGVENEIKKHGRPTGPFLKSQCQVQLISLAAHLAKFIALATSHGSDSFRKTCLAEYTNHLNIFESLRSTRYPVDGNVFGISVWSDRFRGSQRFADLPQTYFADFRFLDPCWRSLRPIRPWNIVLFSPATNPFWFRDFRSTRQNRTCALAGGAEAYMADEAGWQMLKPRWGNHASSMVEDAL